MNRLKEICRLQDLVNYHVGLNQRIGAELLQRDARIEALEAALKPFAQTGWMTGEIEHTARTIVAHMHPEREREIILSSDDFKRARAALAPEQDK